MPDEYTPPGVYVQVLPEGVHSFAGVETSVAAFVGRSARGPVEIPTRVSAFGDYERMFGGLWRHSSMGYAVMQFFRNGGSKAWIVRVIDEGASASLELPGGLGLQAVNPGTWGNGLRARVDHNTTDPLDANTFNLHLRDTADDQQESYADLTLDPASGKFITRVLQSDSLLARVSGALPTQRPAAHPDSAAGNDPMLDDATSGGFEGGDDGGVLGEDHLSGAALRSAGKGIWALDRADAFNLLCIPPLSLDPVVDIGAQTRLAAADYCRRKRAIFLADPPADWSSAADVTGPGGLNSASWGLAGHPDAALYFPRITEADPLRNNQPASFAPCGAVAGIIARTDGQRGTWKAPAGTGTRLIGVSSLTVPLRAAELEQLNPLGVNCLWERPGLGRVVWGARTLASADNLGSEWKYLPVRRLALYIEESLHRGLQWAVFEPNDERLWTHVRQGVDAFMEGLFRRGAFAGGGSSEAFFTRCGRDTMTRGDIEAGVLILEVGFAPLRPAEFVVLRIRQLAAQAGP